MNVKRILVATDFSTCSTVALEQAAALARGADAQLDIVHVLEHPFVDPGFGVAPDAVTDRDWVKQRLTEVQPSDSSLELKHHLLDGEPADAIVRYAKDADVDLIVIGTHSRKGINRLLLGSVAEAIVRRSPCSVLTYKSKPVARQAEQASTSAANESR